MLKDTLEDTKNTAVEFLKDGKGLYGLRVNYDYAFSDSSDMFVRPDKAINKSRANVPSLFHAIPGGKKAKWWSVSTEATMHDKALQFICREKGLKANDGNVEIDFKSYYITFSNVRGMINARINRLYSELIPEEHLKILRRYPVNCRNAMYSELCRGGVRAWQLATVFPALAWYIIPARRGGDEMRDHAFDLVLKGARLRDVAAVAGVPVSFRRFPPALVKWVIGKAGEMLRNNPGLVENHCPATVPRMRAWLNSITVAADKNSDPAFPVWIAKHGMRIAPFREVPRIVSDIGDFVQAGFANSLIDQIDPEQVRRVFALMSCKEPFTQQPPANLLDPDPLIPRPFSPEMAPQTVKRLSDQWHEDVSRIEAEKVTFPPAWYQGGTVGGVSIEPIQDHVELSAQARRFRNCAATYSKQIASGFCYLFTASHEGKPVAMIELKRGNPPRLAQVSGPCNKKLETRITRAINQWFRERLKIEGNGKAPLPPAPVQSTTQAQGFEEIPF